MSDMGNWGWVAFWSVNAVTVVILVRCIVSESSWPGSSGDESNACANKKQCPCEQKEDKESQ